MTLMEQGYLPRLVDEKIERYLKLFGALSIEGPKWCGKTWTALNHANSVIYLLDPENSYANREAARLNPASILEPKPGQKDEGAPFEGSYPLLVDEWQEVPGIWDAVRFACDRKKMKGLFLLTGSATPQKDAYIHSGAGRIARIRMHPMSLFESGLSGGSVSLSRLFDGEKIPSHTSKLSQNALIDLIVRGGWPENRNACSEDAGLLPEQYIEALARTDISHADNARRNPQLVLHLLGSLARCTATTALNSAIASDVQARFGDVTRQTVSAYISALKRLYVIEEIPQWFPQLRDKLRLRKMPKRILADPSIAASALQAGPNDLKRDPRTLGGLFENLCLRDLQIYANSIGAKLSHYHDSNGLEVDAILELGWPWSAIEIKLGSHRVEEGVEVLSRLSAKVQSKGAPAPAFTAVLTGGGPAHTLKDGVHIIPIDCLRE
jgi:predicted AAA+ superfamily ATPase